MNCLTPKQVSIDGIKMDSASTNVTFLLLLQALTGDCGFLAANLYARSIFGEDALANISIEKPIVNEGAIPKPVQGHVRIRAKTQV